MALAVDASSPVAVRNANATTTTASFSPPASLLVAFVHADANSGATTEQCTVTSTGGLSWSLALRGNGSPGGTVEIWSATASSAPGSITVSVTDNQGSVDKSLFVRVLTDTAVPAGIGATATDTTNNIISYTSTVANSWGWCCGLGGGTVGASGDTLADTVNSGGFDGGDTIWTISKLATTSTAGTTVSLDAAGTSVAHHIAVEVLPAGPTFWRPPIIVSSTAAIQAGIW